MSKYDSIIDKTTINGLAGTEEEYYLFSDQTEPKLDNVYPTITEVSTLIAARAEAPRGYILQTSGKTRYNTLPNSLLQYRDIAWSRPFVKVTVYYSFNNYSNSWSYVNVDLNPQSTVGSTENMNYINEAIRKSGGSAGMSLDALQYKNKTLLNELVLESLCDDVWDALEEGQVTSFIANTTKPIMYDVYFAFAPYLKEVAQYLRIENLQNTISLKKQSDGKYWGYVKGGKMTLNSGEGGQYIDTSYVDDKDNATSVATGSFDKYVGVTSLPSTFSLHISASIPNDFSSIMGNNRLFVTINTTFSKCFYDHILHSAWRNVTEADIYNGTSQSPASFTCDQLTKTSFESTYLNESTHRYESCYFNSKDITAAYTDKEYSMSEYGGYSLLSGLLIGECQLHNSCKIQLYCTIE